jgi:tRNA(fMet)-specific endonuclease VapC
MSGRYLLDTNIVVALFQGDAAIEAGFEAAQEVFLPSVALGELHFGAVHSRRPEANAARIDDLAATCTVVGVDAETARRYGQLKGELREKGRPIPENDLWIAACALQHGLILATRDRHFDQVEGLQVETW